MDFNELIRVRESCRKYSGKPVTTEQLRTIVEAAGLAPSSRNDQPWRFIAVNGGETAAKIARCTQKRGLNAFTENVSAFVIALESENAPHETSLSGQDYTLGDIGAAVAHLVLCASEIGLSTCIFGCFDSSECKATLGLPDDAVVTHIIAVGYAADDAVRPKKRRALDEILTVLE